MKTTTFTSDFENLPEPLQKQILDYVEFLKEKYVNTERKKKRKSKIKLTDLKGLGKNLWKDIDVEKHIESERQWD